MSNIHYTYYHSPVGELILGSHGEELCLCDWQYRKMRQAIDDRLLKGLDATWEEAETPLLHTAKEQLDQYFRGELRSFSLPVKLVGTPFQKAVWKALMAIPYGKTTTYQKLSEQLGNPNAIRAVAAANGANALSIIIPCHRVIGSDGQLIGYAGGLRAKQHLLTLESQLITPTLF